MRIGSGYDVHCFQEGRQLVLGGVAIPHSCGLLGHSDADVLLHAICDALLGAAALGDIGRHFPDSDPAFRGVSSLDLLRKVGHMIREAGYAIVNVDSTVVAQRPRLAPYITTMRVNIADTLEMDIERVSVKATTTEGLGFTGREEGIAAQAVVLID
ncbi:2-C-methyl-D-erythritol 2,4-cyclodiphosphate synthase [Syntrophomonas erecta]